jgi:hypothetical protein
MHQYDRSESSRDGGPEAMTSFLGIDVGKSDFHATLLVDDRSWAKSFPNLKAGLIQLASWLRNRKIEQVHACLESTGALRKRLRLICTSAATS